MILGGLLAFAVVSFLVSGWLQSVSAEYSNVPLFVCDIKDFDFDLPSSTFRFLGVSHRAVQNHYCFQDAHIRLFRSGIHVQKGGCTIDL